MDADGGSVHGFATDYVERMRRLLAQVPVEDVVAIMAVLERALQEHRQVFLAGNGGSAATAAHMATDLSKTVAGNAGEYPGFRAISLTENAALLSAWANDTAFEEIFVGQLRSLAEPGDVLLLISVSGESRNLLRAAAWAREHGLRTLALLGRDGGQLRRLVDAAVVVPAQEYGPIEDVHLMLNHLFTAYFQRVVRSSRAASVEASGA